MPGSQRLRGPTVGAVAIDDDFWGPRIERNRSETIEYQYEQLETSGCLGNFRRAAGGEPGEFEGMWFADTDAYKWLEAASYVLATDDDPDLERRVDEVIDLVADAQAEDGYLNTYFTLEAPDKRWTNLNMMHECYCAGHLVEAAVAHHRATEKRTLLDVAVDFADHIDEVFGDAVDGAPGHQEIELALVELARVTDDDSYVHLARYFVEQRGRVDRFEEEFETPEGRAGYDPDAEEDIIDGARGVFYEDGDYDGQYAQAHAPLEDQDAVEGHAVRAMYFYSGVADLAAETGDDELLGHLERLWENMTTKRTYVTGGIGSAHHGERFTEDYDLPNDTAYAETCAAIGSIFWNQRMFELTGEAKYADLIERTLYNGFLAGVSLDGTEFFYDNRLASDGDHTRQGWFDCACCPPNVARLFASLGRYLYATGDERLSITQYVGSTATLAVGGTDIEVTQTTAFPWESDVTVDVDAAESAEFSVELRVPDWAEGVEVAVDGDPAAVDQNDGFVTIDRRWDENQIGVTFERRVRVLRSHPAVQANAGRVALEYGPLVYCLEAVDHGRALYQIALDPDAPIEPVERDDLLDGVVTLEGSATVRALDGWEGELYRTDEATTSESTGFTAVPYYAWDNRETGPMRVWLRSDRSQ